MDTQVKDRMMNRMVDMVEKAAGMRGDAIIPSEFTRKALEMAEKGEVEIERYPLGAPTLKGIYDLSLKLFQSK